MTDFDPPFDPPYYINGVLFTGDAKPAAPVKTNPTAGAPRKPSAELTAEELIARYKGGKTKQPVTPAKVSSSAKTNEELIAEFLAKGGKAQKCDYVAPVAKKQRGGKIDGRKECVSFLDAKRAARRGGRHT